MPLQNRVTPFGDIVAIPQRGMFTGNRGVIAPDNPDTAEQALDKQSLARLRPRIQGARRTVMASRSWTELFFLDEAIALAAGHRPCFFCRRDAARAFRDAWVFDRAVRVPRAAEIDTVLHTERLEHGRKRLHPLTARPVELPEGAVIAAASEPYTLAHGRAFRIGRRVAMKGL